MLLFNCVSFTKPGSNTINLMMCGVLFRIRFCNAKWKAGNLRLSSYQF